MTDDVKSKSIESEFDTDYQTVARLYHSDKILVGVDRAVARQYFAKFPFSKWGISPFLSYNLAFLFLLSTWISSFFVFSWWAIGFILVYTFIYMIYLGQSSLGGANLSLITLCCVCVFVVVIYNKFSLMTNFLIISCVMSFWFIRCSYVIAAKCFIQMVLENKSAYDAFKRYLVIKPAS